MIVNRSQNVKCEVEESKAIELTGQSRYRPIKAEQRPLDYINIDLRSDFHMYLCIILVFFYALNPCMYDCIGGRWVLVFSFLLYQQMPLNVFFSLLRFSRFFVSFFISFDFLRFWVVVLFMYIYINTVH